MALVLLLVLLSDLDGGTWLLCLLLPVAVAMLLDVAADEATRTDPAVGVEEEVAIRKRLRGCSARDLIVDALDDNGSAGSRARSESVSLSDGTREGGER